MTPDRRLDKKNTAGMVQALKVCKPAALVHSYWRSNMYGPNTGVYFAVEVRVADGCAMHIWFAEGFDPQWGDPSTRHHIMPRRSTGPASRRRPVA